MKSELRVIELFVKNVPRGDIPANANRFVQSLLSGNLLYSSGRKKPTRNGSFWNDRDLYGSRKAPGDLLASDACDAIISRAELMRAYDLTEQGFTLWFGDKPPVGSGVMVDVFFRNEERGKESGFSHYYRWSVLGVDTDIIAYKLSKSPVQKVDPYKRSTIPPVKQYEYQMTMGHENAFKYAPPDARGVAISGDDHAIAYVMYEGDAIGNSVMIAKLTVTERYIPKVGDEFYLNHNGDGGDCHGKLECVGASHKGIAFRYMEGDQVDSFDSCGIACRFLPAVNLPF